MSGKDSHDMVVVLTALNLEYQAVRAYVTNIELTVHPAGVRFEIGTLSGTSWRIAIAVVGEGLLTTAVVTEQAIAMFKPVALMFVGIAGALRSDLDLGDVAVATRVYTYHGGRVEPDGFKARPRSWEVPIDLTQLARHVALAETWTARLTGPTTANPPRVHFGAIAAGEVVLNSHTSPLARQLHHHYNDAMAIEMESAGMTHAAFLNKSTPAITIRGISDTAAGDKNGSDAQGWQRVAASHAAAFAVAVIAEYPPRQSEPHVSTPPGPGQRGPGQASRPDSAAITINTTGDATFNAPIANTIYGSAYD